MTGECVFTASINIDWIIRHKRKNIEVCEALADLASFASYNSIMHRAPCFSEEHALVSLVNHYTDSMNWTDVNRRWAFSLAAKRFKQISIEQGYLSPP
jgi:hypothetical protein